MIVCYCFQIPFNYENPSFGNILNKQTKGTFAPAWWGNNILHNSKKKKKGAFRLLKEIRYRVNVCCLSPPHFKMQIRFCTALKKMPQKKRHSLSLLILILFSPASLVFPLQGLGSISDVIYFFFLYRRCKQQKSDYRYQGLVCPSKSCPIYLFCKHLHIYQWQKK